MPFSMSCICNKKKSSILLKFSQNLSAIIAVTIAPLMTQSLQSKHMRLLLNINIENITNWE
jgi:hypothetical protein